MDKKILFLIMLFMSRFAQSLEATWDLTFDNGYNLPSVTMDLQGEKTPFIFDTGSKSALHLPMALINKIPNKTENAEKMKLNDLTGDIKEVRSFIVDKLKLGSFIFNNVPVLEYKNWGLFIPIDLTKNNHEKKELM
ncbi:aspartyl protease family protein [Gilliamella apicola]|uniref:aspartyl protease family protein n=1 Tax=Gilliamella apicola TaxID=1196095 RepID=UPI0027407F5C|nr:aspartyl protease family protein [Gilliamella apicola]WLS91194.1 aspartyl protease family protein [Gilliamella apicola]